METLTFKSDSRISAADRNRLRAFCSNLGEEIVGLANDLGLKVFVEDLLPYESGFLEYAPTCGSKSNYRIVVNGNQPPERQRFSVAHELAHFLLHRGDDVLPCASETRHRSDDPFVYLDKRDSKMESEANRFAAALLMPPNLFVPAFRRLGGDISQVAKLFDVSSDAATKRARELKLGQQ